MLQSMGLRRVAHDWSTELPWVSGPLDRVGAAAWDAQVLPAPTMFPSDPCGHKSLPSTLIQQGRQAPKTELPSLGQTLA